MGLPLNRLIHPETRMDRRARIRADKRPGAHKETETRHRDSQETEAETEEADTLGKTDRMARNSLEWSCIPELLPEEDAWKARPPYAIQSPEQFGPVQWQGHCHCGQVTYVLNRDKPLNAKFCHCRGCQLMHGAPFQWAAIFDKSSVSFTKGVQGLGFYCSSHFSRRYGLPTKVSCTFCHTPIMDEGRNMCLLFPESIQVPSEDWMRFKSDFQVSCHIFYEQRVLEIPDGKPKWASMNDSSQQLDDQGIPLE